MMYRHFSSLVTFGLLILLSACGSNDRSMPGVESPLVNPPTVNPPNESGSLIGTVLDYTPAPGQHINKLPAWTSDDTRQTIIQKADEALKAGRGISLGGFGGSITIALSRRVANRPGRDLRIMGNAIEWNPIYNPNKNPPGLATSSEPGIVQVAYDSNGNGQADMNEWFELSGVAHTLPTTIRDYSITYYRPKSDHTPTPATGAERDYIVDTQYIRWEDNQGQTGFIPRNSYHHQSYFPEWITGESYTLRGTRLASHVVREEDPVTKQSFWTAYALGWGYVDDMIVEHEGSTFDIDWAVDASGMAVSLPAIDFVRIYTGMHALAGVMGEVSTDVVGIKAITSN